MFNEPTNSPDPEFDTVLGWPQSWPESNPVGGSLPPPGNNAQHSRIYDFHNRFDPVGAGIEIPPHWAVPWSDLMMVMMVMFAVMYVTKISETNVGDMFSKEAKYQPLQEPAAAKKVIVQNSPISADEILRLSQSLVTQAKLEDIDVALTDNQAVKVSVRGNLLFDLGKADLKPEAISFLDKLAEIIANNNFEVEIVGHTDNFPISNPAYPTNWELSTARAARVARYLIQTGGLEPGRFTLIGHAFYRPSVPNTSPENKAKNRRVEIIITRNEYTP